MSDPLSWLRAPCVMGILNATPDSLWGGAGALEPAQAMDRLARMAADGAAIRLADTSLTENLTFDRDISIDLSGGYESTFTTVTGQTIISGSLTLTSGTVSLSDIVLQ